MNPSRIALATAFAVFATQSFARTASARAASPDEPYKVVKSEKVGGAGGFDYVFADADGRRLYVPRSGATGRVSVYDLDTLKLVGEVPDARGVHGATVDPKSSHGFSSSNPV